MGFETLEGLRLFTCINYFEAVPMGFETIHLASPILYISHFEAVPMGFETTKSGNGIEIPISF